MAPAVWSYDPATGTQVAIPAPDLVGSIILGAPGTLIAGLCQAVSRLDLASGAFSPILTPPGLTGVERLNDGKTDRQGRFLTGSLVPAGVHPPPGKPFRFAPDRPPEVLAEGIEISNTICFSPAGDRLYFADSLRMAIWTYAYDPETGALGPQETLIDTTPLGSAPDGATVDAEGQGSGSPWCRPGRSPASVQGAGSTGASTDTVESVRHQRLNDARPSVCNPRNNQSARGCLKGRTLCVEIRSEAGTFVSAGYSIRTIINWSVYSAIREVYRIVTG